MRDDLVKRHVEALRLTGGDLGDLCQPLADAIEALTAERDEAINQLDSAIHSVEVLEKRVAEFMADNARLREERDAILSDSTIHSDQREKYERLCARIAAGKASQQDAVDAIRQLCRDNERLALRRSDARAALKGETP